MKRKQRQPKKPPVLTFREIPFLLVSWFGLAGRVLIELGRVVKRDMRKLWKR